MAIYILILPPFQINCQVYKYRQGLVHGSLVESSYNLIYLSKSSCKIFNYEPIKYHLACIIYYKYSQLDHCSSLTCQIYHISLFHIFLVFFGNLPSFLFCCKVSLNVSINTSFMRSIFSAFPLISPVSIQFLNASSASLSSSV